jgi:hypothetical protein
VIVSETKTHNRFFADRLFVLFYATMTAAGYFIEFVFAPLGLIPSTRNPKAIRGPKGCSKFDIVRKAARVAAHAYTSLQGGSA